MRQALRVSATGLALLVACTSGSGSPPPVRVSQVHGSPSPAITATPRSEPFVRTCETSVYGDLGPSWRRTALAAGLIAFVGPASAGVAPADDFAAVGGKYRSVKALAVVDQGAEVTVSVSAGDRAHAALLYDPSAFSDQGLYSLADGRSA